jgi:hypothetical protein
VRRLLPAAAVVLLTGCASAPGLPTTGTFQSASASGPAARGDTHVAEPRPQGAHVSRPAPSQVVPERPTELELPSGRMLGVEVSVTDPRGRLSLPHDVDQAGWWRDGARLGDRFGAVVLAAHVDSFAEGIGPIAELLGAVPGDELHLRSRSLAQEYIVTSADLVPRDGLAGLAPALSFTGSHRLVVITCGGPYDAASGGYQDNLVVVAEPRGRLMRG